MTLIDAVEELRRAWGEFIRTLKELVISDIRFIVRKIRRGQGMIIFGKEAKELQEYKEKYFEARRQQEILLNQKDFLETKVRRLECELKNIKPVIETSGWRPAVSDKCKYCDYAYFSAFNGELLGCCKDAICSDFKAKERK